MGLLRVEDEALSGALWGAQADDGRADASAGSAVLAAAGPAGAGKCAGAGKLRVFDLHCDTLDRLALHENGEAVFSYMEGDNLIPHARMSSLLSNDAHISLERTAAFDWCQCFAVFIPDDLRGQAAWSFYLRIRDFFRAQCDEHAARLARVVDSRGALGAFSAGKTAGMLTVEGAAFLDDDAHAEERLDAIADDGVRMVTLTWNGRNALGSGNDTDEGLTPFGKRCVAELEARDIAVDVSHLNDAGFKDVLACAEKPFAASHSNARAVCGHPRNLDDWQLREIADRGGIVGFNYYNAFLTDRGGEATRDDALRHIDHMLGVAGEDTLALGSDYDGSEVPSWLFPCTGAANLHAIVAAEFGEEVAAKMFWENAARFFGREG